MVSEIGRRFRSLQSKPASFWFAALLGIGLVVRIALLLTYQPVAYGDTNSYFRLAQAIAGVGERGYDGTRVPGYPAFVALLGIQERPVWIAQMALGLAISLLLFWMTWKTTGRPEAGFLVGALYTLIPGQFLFESNLLTETLTTFFIVASFTVLLAIRRNPSIGWSIALAFVLGFTSSAVGLTRPLFFPLTLWLLPFVWFGSAATIRDRLMITGAFALLPLLMQGGWLCYMQSHWGVLSPTAMAGYSMVQHTGEFFEYLPDEYAAIRDTYLEYRAIQVAARGVQTNTIWEAIPAISKASGLGFYDLSRKMQELSWLLIRDHPLLYARNVLEGWLWFWKAPVYWRPNIFSSEVIGQVMAVLAIVGRGISVLANFVFLILSAGAALSRKVRAWVKIDAMLVATGGFVLLSSVLQTFLDHGDNPRFLVPLQMVVIYVVVRAWVGPEPRKARL